MSKEETITVELTPVEIFQLTLSVGHRIGGLMELFATATNGESEKSYQSQLAYLDSLNNKLKNKLLEAKKDGEQQATETSTN